MDRKLRESQLPKTVDHCATVRDDTDLQLTQKITCDPDCQGKSILSPTTKEGAQGHTHPPG